MKRPVNFFDLFTALLLVAKLVNPNAPFSYWMIFLPWIMEIILHFGTVYIKVNGIDTRLRWWLIKKITARKIKSAAKKARRGVASGNPGLFTDKEKQPR